MRFCFQVSPTDLVNLCAQLAASLDKAADKRVADVAAAAAASADKRVAESKAHTVAIMVRCL